MTARSWMRQLFARTPGNVRKAPARFRPQLESLESRYVLSTLMVTNNFDTGVSDPSPLTPVSLVLVTTRVLGT